MLASIHPSQMDTAQTGQYAHIRSAIGLAFMQGGMTAQHVAFRRTAHSSLILPKLFTHSNYIRDVFVCSITLFKDIPLIGVDFESAKGMFHTLLGEYVPKADDKRHMGNVIGQESLHIRPRHWTGKYYENSHTISLLVQGLTHDRANNTV